jgi:hypothetical protein
MDSSGNIVTAGPWSIQTFTTTVASNPSTTTVTVYTTTAVSTATDTITVIAISPKGSEIPTYLLWVFIGVDAVLVITVIILTFKTRRIQ